MRIVNAKKMNTKFSLIIGLAVFLSLTFVSLTSALVINSVTTSPSEIAPGENSLISIEIENNGNSDIEEVSVSLIFKEVFRDALGNIVSSNELPFAPYDSASEVSFDEIRENREETADFKIKALSDAESGTYKIPVEIKYTENEIEKTKTSLISLNVNAEPIIGASLEDGLLLKGQENSVSVKIVNKGLSNVKFLEVELQTGRYTILSQENVYIGDVDSDDFDVAEFRLLFKENSPSTIILPVKVIYKDALNNEYEEEFILDARVYTKDEAIKLGLLKKSNVLTYLIIIIVLIAIWIVYRKIKKRRKMKKMEEK